MVLGLTGLCSDRTCICHNNHNRQMLFYCGLFSTFTGAFWIFMGLVMRYAWPTPISTSVTSVAYGIILVGTPVTLVGLMIMASVVITCRITNKTSALSSQEDLTESSVCQSKEAQNDVVVSVLP